MKLIIMQRNNLLKLLILGSLTILIASFYIFSKQQGIHFDLAYIQTKQVEFTRQFNNNPLLFFIIYFTIYVTAAAASLPLASILTVLAGAIFGLAPGLLLVSVASTIGASLAFLGGRFILKESLQQRYPTQMKKINQGFNNDGNFYLFAMRIVPVLPFFVVNLGMSVVPIKLRDFFWISQLGMLPGTFVYVYAGTELVKIESLADIASPGLIIAFTLLGIFPILGKKAIQLLKERRAHD